MSAGKVELKLLKKHYLKELKHLVMSVVPATMGLSAALIALIGSTSSLNKSDFENFTQTHDAKLLALFAAASATLFMATLTYLNKTRRRSSAFPDSILPFGGDTKKIISFQRLAARLGNDLRKVDKDKVREAIENQIDDLAHTELLARISQRVLADDRAKRYTDLMEQSVNRMRREIEALEFRGNLNLSIGIVATIIGITTLGVFVFTANYANVTISQFLYSFAPRISLVLSIEIFAFFVLGLYKYSLTEIKYYHNELTSAEARIAAVVIGSELPDQTSYSKLVCGLAEIDRNSAPNTEQKAELERSAETLGKLLTAIAPFVKKD